MDHPGASLMDVLIFGSYFMITVQLIVFVRELEVAKLLISERAPRKRKLLWMAFFIILLFACFIAACGMTHLMVAGRRTYPENPSLRITYSVVSVLCAFSSMVTAVIGVFLFPALTRIVKKFELNDEGKLQLMGAYLIETLELFKESIVILDCSGMKIKRGNSATASYFGDHFLNHSVTMRMHPYDVPVFEQIIALVSDETAYANSTDSWDPAVPTRRPGAPIVWQYRVRSAQNVMEYIWVESTIRRRSTAYDADVAAEEIEEEEDDHDGVFPEEFGSRCKWNDDDNDNVSAWSSELDARPSDEETGLRTTRHRPHPAVRQRRANRIHPVGMLYASFGFDDDNNSSTGAEAARNVELVMITRNVNERKQAETVLRLAQSNAEKNKMNESKLKYISSIAHDLKTPLQTFTFAVDTLRASSLSPEQREVLNDARVASELMKLTILQTMACGKLLTGGKLVPVIKTVNLSALLKRVDTVIKGFGAQVPITYEVSRDVRERFRSDEEFLWQMLLNLLTNACKYTEDGEIRVKVSLVLADAAAASSSVSASVDAVSIESGSIIGEDVSKEREAKGKAARASLIGSLSSSASCASSVPPQDTLMRQNGQIIENNDNNHSNNFPSPNMRAHAGGKDILDLSSRSVSAGKGAEHKAAASAASMDVDMGVSVGCADDSSGARRILVAAAEAAAEAAARLGWTARASVGGSRRQVLRMLRFEVFDTGIGLGDVNIDALFQPFGVSRRGQTTGTGLGLFGLRSHADALGGRCGARKNAAAETGSVFWFDIPYVEDSSVAQICTVSRDSSRIEILTASSLQKIESAASPPMSWKSGTFSLFSDVCSSTRTGERSVPTPERVVSFAEVQSFVSYESPSARARDSFATISSEASSVGGTSTGAAAALSHEWCEQLQQPQHRHQLLQQQFFSSSSSSSSIDPPSPAGLAFRAPSHIRTSPLGIASHTITTSSTVTTAGAADKSDGLVKRSRNRSSILNGIISYSALPVESGGVPHELPQARDVRRGSCSTTAVVHTGTLKAGGAGADGSGNVHAAVLGAVQSQDDGFAYVMPRSKGGGEGDGVQQIDDKNDSGGGGGGVGCVGSRAEEWHADYSRHPSFSRQLSTTELSPKTPFPATRHREDDGTTKQQHQQVHHRPGQPPERFVESETPTKPPPRQLTAIVVDDVLVVRRVMERMLKQLGFASIECYPNGKRGLDAMMAKEVDVVFSDVQMPIMSGPEMVQHFREFEAGELAAGRRQKRQIVIAVTANGQEQHEASLNISATAGEERQNTAAAAVAVAGDPSSSSGSSFSSRDELVSDRRFDRLFLKPVERRDVRAVVNELLGAQLQQQQQS